MRYKMGILYIASGLIFLFFSGSAEGFASPRSLVIGVALVALFHVMWIVIGFLRKKIRPGMAFNFLAIFILFMSLVIGSKIDAKRVAETKQIGDQIVEKINFYRQKNGSYPSSLSEIPNTLQPTLKNSEFYYHIDEKDGFILGFPSVTFLLCERSAHSQWVCDD
jgi:hypothetical protein